MKATRLRALIAQGRPIVTPTAHDALSARLIEMAGFDAIALGGSSMLAARYGLPDLGLAGFAEMAETAADIVGAVELPAIADADDGYGDAKNVVRTLNAYERIGVAGFVLEDQERASKRPGDGAALGVVEIAAMAAKLRAASRHRTDPDTLIIARTDCYALEGIDGALRRCHAYLAAGADGIFVPGISRHEEFARIGAEFPGIYKIVVQVEGSRTPFLPANELFRLGFAQIVYPSYILNRVIGAIEAACREIEDASAAGSPPAVLATLAHIRSRYDKAVRLDTWRAIET